jgi:hypothetical protein
MEGQQPILVTGAHRTGTTWVGKMLTVNRQTAYISEPLNVLHRPGVLRVPVSYWYTYITRENEVEFLPGFLDTLSMRYRFDKELRALRSGKDFLRMGRDVSNFTRGRLLHRCPLLKDPFAVFSSAWFQRRLNCQVVITVRHPAAFASSLKKLDWPFDFSHLIAQPLLMRDWLEPFRSRIESAAATPPDTIYGASLLWCLIYDVVARLQQDYPSFILVRQEDFAIDPLNQFRGLYGKLGLSFTPKVEAAILKASSVENPTELSKGATHSVRLDSRASLENWKRRLSVDEIYLIREQTEELSNHFYPDFQWE